MSTLRNILKGSLLAVLLSVTAGAWAQGDDGRVDPLSSEMCAQDEYSVWDPESGLCIEDAGQYCSRSFQCNLGEHCLRGMCRSTAFRCNSEYDCPLSEDCYFGRCR